MAIVGAGLGASLGVAQEASGSYGVFVAPTVWPEFLDESFKWVPKVVQGKGISGTLTPLKSRRVVVSSTVKGGVKMYAQSKGMGKFLKQLFGSATITQGGTTAAWTQVHTVGDVTGQSLSIQVNRPDTSKADHPYSYSGLKITDGKITANMDEIVEFDFTMVGQKQSTTPTLTAPAPVPTDVFTFTQGVVVAGALGSETEVLSVSKADIDFKRPMDEARITMGGNGLILEPIQNNFIDVGGTLDTEFLNATDWETAFETQAPLSLIMTFTGSQIAAGYNEELKVAIPNIYFEGDGPSVGGPEIIKPSYKFKATDDGTNGLITVTYVSTDTAI